MRLFTAAELAAHPAVFASSDSHFRHGNIVSYTGRPFLLHDTAGNVVLDAEGQPLPDIDAMDAALVANWNATVGDGDLVFFLGDFAMRVVPDDALRFVAMLNGRKILIAGNHDKCWSGHRKGSEEWTERYLAAGFDEIHTQASVEMANRTVLMCHFPYAGDSHGTDRYREHRPVDRGSWLLHGHVHDAWKVNGRQINVGADVWDYTPVGLPVLEELIRAA